MYKKLIFSWDRFPALFILASLVSGGMLYLGIAFPLLLAFTHPKHSFKAGYLLLSFFISLLFTLNHQTTAPVKTGYVSAYIEPKKIKERHHKFFLWANCPYLIYKDGKEYKNIKVTIAIPKQMIGCFNYNHIVSGTLKKSSYGYFLTADDWKKNSFPSCLTSSRFLLHRKATSFIKKQVTDKDVQAYFSALITGSINDPFLREKFLEAGMLHTLAISGFHFSWVIFILSIPLSLIMKKKWSLLALLAVSWCYFLFPVGSLSISRAWIAISVYLLSILFSKPPLPLNALGSAGILSIIIDPYSLFEPSFALSFLATFTIITLFPLIGYITDYICMRRPKQIISLMPFIDKIAYYLLRFFTASFFLSLLIQIVLLPISIHFFPFISLWGLLYNLFIPISMVPTLLLLILCFIALPFGNASFLWSLNEAYSKPFLEAILYGKGASILLIKTPNISPQILSITLCLTLFLCLKLESFFFEKSLDKLDEYLLT